MGDDVKWWLSSCLRSASSRETPQRDPMLEACDLLGDNGQVKTCLREAFP